MSEHVALFVDGLVASTAAHGGDSPLSIAVGRASFSAKKAPAPLYDKQISHQKSSSSMPAEDELELHRSGSKNSILDGDFNNIEDSFKSHRVAVGECRICQEEDDIINLESPCACTGSLKFAHRKCVQHWCNEKGNTVCEICRKPYEGGYTTPPSSAPDSFTINIDGGWEGQRLNLHESRIFSVASEHHFLDSDYEEYARANERSAACFRAVAFILMVLLLLRHISSMTSTVTDDGVSTFIVLFFLRALGFFLPCYIMVRALNALHCRRQREEAALAAAEVVYLFQSGQVHGVPVAVTSDQ